MPDDRSVPRIDHQIAALLERLQAAVLTGFDRHGLVYVWVLFTAALTYLVLLPIASSDTDLWYHLNGGRLYWEFGEFPDSAFYSFMDGARRWVNYFWGFQLSTYQIHHWFGYEGLIALRVLLITVSFWAIAAILVRRDDHLSQRAWSLVVLALVMMVLMGRAGHIRPHLVSYAMIPLFLVILERRRDWLPVLPLLTVVWANTHGVEWPVGALIGGAYLADAAWRQSRGDAEHRTKDRQLMLWVLACVPAALLNPFGIAIVTAPFNTPSDVYEYIVELQPYSVWAAFSIALTGPVISNSGAVAMLNWINVLAYGRLLIHRRLRLAPLFLSIAGIYLMSRGTRFIWEWALLSLPLWRGAIDLVHPPRLPSHQGGITLAGILLAFVLTAPLVNWVDRLGSTHGWPLDSSHLPVGVTEFVAGQGAEGRIVVPPTYGGYFAWRLYPKVLISGDMQTPPTVPWDHFRRSSTLSVKAALTRYLTEFDPELIAVEVGKKGFREQIKQYPGYRPVSFDDEVVLYADARRLPDLVQRYELRHTNPFNLLDGKSGKPEERIAELRRILAEDPDGDRVQHGLTRLLFDQKRFVEALPVAEHFVATRPLNPNSHYLLGNTLENLNRCDEARRHFLDAIDVSDDEFQKVLHRHIGACAYLEQDFGEAFEHFAKGVATYTGGVEREYMFQYAVSAVAVGNDEKARSLLDQLLYVSPLEDDELALKAKALLDDL